MNRRVMSVSKFFAMTLMLLPVAANAEWFLRGTANSWVTTQMDFVSGATYKTCQSFGLGDGGGGPRFKIDRHGDWSESYPSNDFSVNSDASYDIEFDAASQTITTTPVSSCSDAFAQNFSTLYFRGTANDWDTTQMQLVADNTWQLTIDFDGQAQQRYKIDVSGNWGQNYGDNEADNVLELSGDDIFTNVVGNYLLEVNDSTLAYSLTTTGVPQNIAPTASINPAEDLTVNVGGTLSFSGTASTDPDGSIVSYLWSTGESSDSISVAFNSPGSELLSLTVTDDGGKTDQASVSVSVTVNDTPTDSWYFRGTPNAWGSTLMTSEDNTNYCTEQVFANGDGGGSPRFKIDHFADWTENYPAQDYVVDAHSRYAVCFNAATKVIVSTKLAGADTPAPAPAAGDDFREETIYFLLTARFYDGDSSNNYYNRDRIKAGDPHWRGDFKGLIQQLDYIEDLGFTAIWVTPPVENRSGLDYHGYHAYDWTKVDPRLESDDATYRDFIDEAHARGLKVIQDVVINHSSQYGIRDRVWIDHLPIKYFVPAGAMQGEVNNDPYFGNLGDYRSLNRDDNDNSAAPQWFKDRHNSDPAGTLPLVDPKTGTTVPLAGYDANRFFGIDASSLDQAWYHPDGFMAGGDWENPIPLQRKHLAGDTIDLYTENKNVRDYLNDAMRMYLDMGVDAIRLDTAKHVERNDLLSYTQNWQAHKPGLFVFGEALVLGIGFGSENGNDNGPAEIRPWWYTRTGNSATNPTGDSKFSVLDFPLFSTFRDNVTRGNFSQIGSVLAKDNFYADPTQLVTFFQNHDLGPDNDFKFRYGGPEGNAALAYNLLWTIRGIPTLYYGEEVQFMAGAPQDIQQANDTIDLTGRAYFGPTLDDPSTPQHNLYRHIKRLNQIRSAVTALQKGPMASVNEWGAGMSFVREFESSYVVVGLAGNTGQDVSVSGVRNGTYRDAVTGNTINVNSGSIDFSVNAFSAGIYVLDGPGKIGVDGAYLN